MPHTKKKNNDSGKNVSSTKKNEQAHDSKKENAAKEVNQDRSENKKDLEVRNKVTGADSDGPVY